MERHQLQPSYAGLSWGAYQKKWVGVAVIALAIATLASSGTYFGSQSLLNSGLTYGSYSALAFSIGILAYAILHIRTQDIPPKLVFHKQKDLQTRNQFQSFETTDLKGYHYTVSWTQLNPQHLRETLSNGRIRNSTLRLYDNGEFPTKGHLDFFQYALKQEKWSALCKVNFPPLQQDSVVIGPEVYDYTNKALYCVFGHKVYGEECDGNKYSSELLAFFQSFKTLALDYFCSKPEFVSGLSTNTLRPTPVLIRNLQRDLKFDEEQNYSKPEQEEKIQKPGYQLVSIATIDWNNNSVVNPVYSKEELLYLLEATYAACMPVISDQDLERTFHVTLRECYHYKNSPRVLMAIQLLAARMAGISIKFYGNDYIPEKEVPQLITLINSGTPLEVLEKIFENQFQGNGWLLWRPKWDEPKTNEEF